MIFPEFIKERFEIKSMKPSSTAAEDFRNNEMINHFVNEISLFAFEQQLKQFRII
ncbi:hypothetical protein [Flavobacterium circumlabens]|uniref:Uncharacterized protein n=1 Tax=Flavobacterium circumlabens TaxID=2133765 RepID=A0ABY2AYZ6_9FLAO|nr:hypothetical protein [Flavobacterium circumlabens]TCN55627.1 hypothetical protein EV142_106319 [Flavobacterium circumlabens]